MVRVSADALCTEVAGHVATHLPEWLGDLPRPEVMDTVPAPEAMDTVTYPAISVASTGLVEPLVRRSRSYAGTFGLIVAVWVEEIDLSETTRTTQRYIEAIRACLLSAGRANWHTFTEDYALIVDPRLSQTLGGGRVSFQVFVDPVMTMDPAEGPSTTPLPLVQRHFESLSLKE